MTMKTKDEADTALKASTDRLMALEAAPWSPTWRAELASARAEHSRAWAVWHEAK